MKPNVFLTRISFLNWPPSPCTTWYMLMDDGSMRVVAAPPSSVLHASTSTGSKRFFFVGASFQTWILSVEDHARYEPGPLYNGGQKYEWVVATPFAPASQAEFYMLRRVQQDAALESPEEEYYSGLGDEAGSEPEARNDESNSDREFDGDDAESSDNELESSSAATPFTTSRLTSAAPAAPTTAAPHRELVLDEDYDAPEDVAAVYEEAAIIARFLARCRRL